MSARDSFVGQSYLAQFRSLFGPMARAGIKTLLDRKLVATADRKEVLGRPIRYKTTKNCLVHFGLKEVGELPS